MLVKFPGNESFKNEMVSPFSNFCMFSFAVTVRKKLLKALAMLFGSFNFSLLRTKEGTYSVGCNYPVSFMMFHGVLTLLLDLAISLL
jgi:hypothetical protein